MVKYQEFRGIDIAVKYFLPHTIAADVHTFLYFLGFQPINVHT